MKTIFSLLLLCLLFSCTSSRYLYTRAIKDSIHEKANSQAMILAKYENGTSSQVATTLNREWTEVSSIGYYGNIVLLISLALGSILIVPVALYEWIKEKRKGKAIKMEEIDYNLLGE